MDPSNGDYHLQPGSPCIDAGNNWAVPPDAADLDADGDMAEFTPIDLDGSPRFADDPATPDYGPPGAVDMGAYEYQGDPFTVKFGDIDGDGEVGIGDFLAIIGLWGPCTETCCLADLDLDGTIGIIDFLFVLGNWG